MLLQVRYGGRRIDIGKRMWLTIRERSQGMRALFLAVRGQIPLKTYSMCIWYINALTVPSNALAFGKILLRSQTGASSFAWCLSRPVQLLHLTLTSHESHAMCARVSRRVHLFRGNFALADNAIVIRHKALDIPCLITRVVFPSWATYERLYN